MALPFIKKMPEGFHTQLGRLYKGGRELSLGQWQKIALSRAFMRTSTDILVLDEPTSAMDAEAEFQIFNHFRQVTQNQMAILISHRFSTVRIADRIAVLEAGELVEQGTHIELLKLGGAMRDCSPYKQRDILMRALPAWLRARRLVACSGAANASSLCLKVCLCCLRMC